MTDLNKLTQEFGQAYKRAKDSDTAKQRLQKRLFEGFTDALSHTILAQRLVPAPIKESIDEYVERYYPGWFFVDQRDDHILIEEDPSLMKFQFINETDGMVYGRTVTEAGPTMDDDELRTNDPDLWNEITDWPEPWYSMFVDGIIDFCNSVTKAEVIPHVADIFEAYGLSKTLTDPNTWTDDQVERVQRYMYLGRISTRLIPPRKATAEELGEV